MTYVPTLPRTEGQAVSGIAFPVRKEVDWLEEGSFFENIAGPSKVAPSSASSAVSREPRIEWEQEILLSLLERRYTIRERNDVLSFLKAYPFLVPLILEAYDRIAEHFGPYPDVVLEIVNDPEAPDYRELFIFIRTDLSPEEAFARLERFDQDWWLDASDRAECLLNIDVEYV